MLRRLPAVPTGRAGREKPRAWSQLFLISVPDAELSAVATALEREGGRRANALFQELRQSHEIYCRNYQDPLGANAQRARLLKQNFRQHMEAAEKSSPPPKVLVKFGDWHLYKGLNPLNQRDLGNYIAELADGEGSTSLHICVLGAKGTHRRYGDYQRPTKLQSFLLIEDHDYGWLRPMIENQLPEAWTLFDLRKLRFQSGVEPGLERLIYGYDFLLMVPQLKPADLIE